MKRFITYVLIIPLLLLWLAAPSFSNDIEDHEVQQYIHNITSASSPKAINQYLIFSQNPEGFTRYVGAAFEHERYNEIHVFKKNRHGVFFLIYPLSAVPKDTAHITYRIVADGLWMTDPQVKGFTRDRRGIRLSVLPVESPGPSEPRETSSLGDGVVWFYYESDPGSHVAVIGDFNNWNPFAHPMREIESGRYAVRIRMTPGVHTYTYIVDGRHVDVHKIETRPEHRVFIHRLGIRAVKITVD